MFDANHIALGIAAGAVLTGVASAVTIRAFSPRRFWSGFGIGFCFAAVFCSAGAVVGALA